MQHCTDIFRFGPFQLEPERRRLLAHDAPVTLSARGYDILEYLIRNRDRVASRDEIVAHVWPGVTVADNNLSVQMSALRRALATHVGRTTIILNVPGRGYRFVADVEIAHPPAPTRAGLIPAGEPPASPRHTRSGLWRNPAHAGSMTSAMLVVALAVILIFAVSVVHAMKTAPGRGTGLDARLTILVERLDADPGDPVATGLARAYTDAIIGKLRVFEDCAVYPGRGPVPAGLRPRYRLTGSVRKDKDEFAISTRIERQDNTADGNDAEIPIPADASVATRAAAAMRHVVAMRGWLFEQERALRPGPPMDARDAYIDARAGYATPQELQARIASARAAVRLDPPFRPARALLANLLTRSMLWSPATLDDGPGREAKRTIDPVVEERPRNFIYQLDRAYNLAALGDLETAEAAARRGLKLEPGDPYLQQTLGEILMQQNRLDEARALIAADDDDPTDDRPAYLEFAAGHYGPSIDRAVTALRQSTDGFETSFTMLMLAAALAQAGRPDEAARVRADALAKPGAFARISSLRQNFYALPDDAWTRFRQGLEMAGMTP